MCAQALVNFRPKKSFGQNFLTNRRVVEKIIHTAKLQGDEFVVEVGPGFGILTEALLKHAGQVRAIEKDKELFAFLKNKFLGRESLELLHADALKIQPPAGHYFLVANIPYSITSPLLDHFIRDNPDRLPLRAVVMVQKEVAQKICAKPPQMNVLALHIQTFGTPKIIGTVSRNNFEPRPKVDSAIVTIEFHQDWKEIPDLKKYFAVIHRGFEHKRKMLRSSFDERILRKAGIDSMKRAETITIEEWKSLAKVDYI